MIRKMKLPGSAVLTRKRRAVLDSVESSPTPLSVKALHKTLRKTINLSTVYRSLEYLEDKGLIEAFTAVCSREGTLRYYHGRERPHGHWFHCESCHAFLPVPCFPLAPLTRRSEELKGSRILNHVMYLTGLCPDCNTKTQP